MVPEKLELALDKRDQRANIGLSLGLRIGGSLRLHLVLALLLSVQDGRRNNLDNTVLANRVHEPFLKTVELPDRYDPNRTKGYCPGNPPRHRRTADTVYRCRAGARDRDEHPGTRRNS